MYSLTGRQLGQLGGTPGVEGVVDRGVLLPHVPIVLKQRSSRVFLLVSAMEQALILDGMVLFFLSGEEGVGHGAFRFRKFVLVVCTSLEGGRRQGRDKLLCTSHCVVLCIVGVVEA